MRWGSQRRGSNPAGVATAMPRNLERVHDEVEVQGERTNDGGGDHEPPFPAAGRGQGAENARQNCASEADGRPPLAVRRDENDGDKDQAGDAGFCGSIQCLTSGIQRICQWEIRLPVNRYWPVSSFKLEIESTVANIVAPWFGFLQGDDCEGRRNRQ